MNNKTTVYVTDDLYFIVEDDHFIFYHKTKDGKNPHVVGYYTSIESLIKRATQIVVSKTKLQLSLYAFLEQWKETQKSLLKSIN